MRQNNSMLQARYRYLQARRDLEYIKLKEEESLKIATTEVATIKPPTGPIKTDEQKEDLPKCLRCGAVFKGKSGLSSHIRYKTCEEK